MARPLRDPIAQSIEGLSQAITGDRPQWQQTVTQSTERLAASVVSATTERVTAPLTNAIRRTVSTSRTRPTESPAVIRSGNVTPGATFQPFQPNGEVPDLDNPPSWFNRPPAREPLPPWWETADLPTVEERQQSTAERAAERAEEACRIVADIAGNGGIPPIPPGGGQPPEPPDEPEDDDSILNRLLEFFQRMFGVRPDIANRSFLDTLANNLTSILGGVIPQPGADGQRPSAVATLMDTFADYFNVPRETEDATREAQDNLRRSIDRLTEATNGAANGGTPSQPQTRWQRFRGFFRRGRTRRGGIATATRLANFMRPVLRGIANVVPSRWRQAAGQVGVNMATQVGGRFGIPAATAARFGAALGPAAIGIGVLAYGLPLIGAAIKATISGLNRLADTALQTTFALANYSGLLAHANAQLEVNREMRKFDMANRMGGFGADRLGQLNRLENAMQPWKAAAGNAGNLWGAMVDSALSTLLEHINSLIAVGMDLQAAILEWVPGDQGEANMRKAAAKLRNPAADMPDLRADIDAVFGQNAAGMIDAARRLNGPRRPVNGGN